MKITHYPNQEVDTIWHKVKDYFEATAEYTYGRYTANDIRTGIKSNSEKQLWIAHEEGKVFGFVVTEPLQYPQLKLIPPFSPLLPANPKVVHHSAQ